MTSTAHSAVSPGRADASARPGFTSTDALLVAMSAIWGVNYSIVKYGTDVMHPLAYNGLRVSLAAVALTAITVVASDRRASRRDLLAMFALGLLGNGLYQWLFIEGIARTRAGDAAIVLAATPACVALIGRALGVERATRRWVAGIALSIGGIALVVLASPVAAGESSLVGNALILGGTVCWSLYTVLLKPYTSRVDGVQVAAVTMSAGALLMLTVAAPAIARTDWTRVTPGAAGAIVYSGLVALVIGYLLWYRGVRVLGPTRTAMYGNLQPVIAGLAAWVIRSEVPTVWQGVGTVAIIGGIVLTRT
jgi:drug/metabolite transporter (DMT)-like permease